MRLRVRVHVCGSGVAADAERSVVRGRTSPWTRPVCLSGPASEKDTSAHRPRIWVAR